MNFNILHITLDNRYGGIYRYIEEWAKSDFKKKINAKHYTFKYKNFSKYLILVNTKKSNLIRKAGYFFIVDAFLNLYNFTLHSKIKM